MAVVGRRYWVNPVTAIYVMSTSKSEQPSTSARSALKAMGLSPRKALGQHFLVGKGVVAMILKAAEISLGETVVEVGPGLGVLTRELVQRAGQVIAVEMDARLASALEQGLADAGNLQVVQADAREVDAAALTEGTSYKLVANLPYYAASPILRHFLESSHPPTVAVVMVQREVARNMVAQPGDMSLMSVGVQLFGRPRIVGYVRPESFYPRPKVTSAVVRIQVYPKPALEVEDTGAFFTVVRAGFSTPRKQLRNSLANGLAVLPEQARSLLEAAGIGPRARAETLRLEEWGALYHVVEVVGLGGKKIDE